MKLLRTRWFPFSSLSLVLLVAAGCGGADDAPEDAAEDDSQEIEAVDEPSEPADVDGDSDSLADAREFYADEEVTFVVSFGEGGGYDRIARAMAPYLEDYLDTSVFIDNRDGAGGLVAANSLYSGDEQGREFGFFAGQGIAAAVLGEAEGVQFGLEEFSYIARVAAEPRSMTTGTASGVESMDEILAMDDFTFASSGPGGADHIDASVLWEVFDLQGDIITGYAGSAETQLAITAGDATAGSGAEGSRMGVISEGDHVLVLAIHDEPFEWAPEVPSILDFELTEEQQTLAEAHLAMQALGRMVMAPPGLPEDRLELLRQAFAAVIEDPDFLAQMEAEDNPIGPYMSGEDLSTTVSDVLEAPELYVDIMRESYGG